MLLYECATVVEYVVHVVREYVVVQLVAALVAVGHVIREYVVVVVPVATIRHAP